MSEWILVGKNSVSESTLQRRREKKKLQKRLKQENIQRAKKVVTSTMSFSEEPEPMVRMNRHFYDKMDTLSLLVYCVMSRYEHALPASAIKKEVNTLIEIPEFLPDYIWPNDLPEKLCQKKDIGWVLYEGPLKDFLICDDAQLPRLWKLNNIVLQETLVKLQRSLSRTDLQLGITENERT